jgi:hypothetical protein
MQLLPGLFNPTNEDDGAILSEDTGVIDMFPYGVLEPNTTVGWVELPFDATSDAAYLLPNGNIGVTLRMWNWRVDAVEVVPEPATLGLLLSCGLATVIRRRRVVIKELHHPLLWFCGRARPCPRPVRPRSRCPRTAGDRPAAGPGRVAPAQLPRVRG